MKMKKKEKEKEKEKEKLKSIESFFAEQPEKNKRTLKTNGSPTSKKNKISSSDAPILIQDDDDPLSCPVCATELKQEDAQRHINLCLDRTSPPLNKNTHLPLSPTENPPTNQQDIKQEKEDDQEGSVKSLLSEPKKPPKYTSKPRLVKTNKKGRSGTEKGEAKKVPFYKLMPGTTLSVDCFSHGAVPGVTGYFLSHAHSDHYTKLSSTWAHGKIYCSKTTANLVILKLRVHPRWLVPLDFNRPYTIEGVRVVLIDANHCPGSAMFLFEGLTKPEGKPFRYLHCGDFRAMPSHLRHPEIHEKVIDICYLDTTYLDPKYCFPAQHQVIDGCCKAMKRRVLEADRSATMSAKGQKKFAEMGRSRDVFKSWLTPSSPAVSLSPAAPSTDQPKAASSKNLDFTRPVSGPAEVPTPNQPKLASIFAPKTAGTRSEPSAKTTLIVVGTYSIGKERIVIELASTLSTKVFCADARKVAILRCVDEADEEAVLQGMLTPNPLAAQIHLVNLFALNKSGFLESYLAKYRAHFSHVIGIKPTGWCYKPASSTIACSPLSQDLAAFIAAFQQQQQESHSNAVGQLIFPEKVKPSIADFVEIYGVPYSEHSSFFELCCFCLSFHWGRIVPTVNAGNPSSRAQMQRWIDRWKSERVRLLKNPCSSSSSSASDSTVTWPQHPASPPPPPPPAAAAPPAPPPLLVPPRSHLFW